MATEPNSKTTSNWQNYLHDVADNVTALKVFQAVAATVAGYVGYKYFSHLIYRKLKGYPAGPVGYPIVGYAKLRTESFLMNVSGLYGAISYAKFVGRDMITINNSQTAKHCVLNRKDLLDHYSAKYHDKHENPFSDIIHLGSANDASFLSENGQTWKVRRQYAMVALIRFCDSKFMSKLLYNVINNVVFRELNKICDKSGNNNNNNNNGGTLWCPHDIFYYISFNTVYHANFGHSLDINDAKFIEMRQNIDEMSDLIKKMSAISLSSAIYRFYEIFYPKLVSQCKETFEKRRNMFDEMIQERRKFLKENKEVLNEISQNKYSKYQLCYIDYLIYLLDHCNDKTDHTITGETTKLNTLRVINDLAIMFFAGTDTTSTTLHYGVFLLAKSPKIQQLLFEKLTQITKSEANGDNNNEVNMLQVSQLMECAEYRAFIYEVLRIGTPLPFSLAHVPKKDVKLTTNENEAYNIPAESIISTNIIYIHTGDTDKTKEKWQNKEFGLKMDQICLENWLVKDENGENKFLMNESFIVFGSGARDCVGQQLAIKEIHLVLAYLILNYQFEAPNGDTSFKINRIHGITAGIDKKQHIIIKKR